LQQQQEGQSDKFKKDLNNLIPVLNTAVDTLHAEATVEQYFNLANCEPEKMNEIIKQLDEKLILFKEFEETSARYNDW